MTVPLGSANEPGLLVTQVSDSVYSPKAHGVHTAYTELLTALSERETHPMSSATRIRHVHSAGPLALAALLMPGRKVVTAHINGRSLEGSIVLGRAISRPLERYLSFLYNRADAVIALTTLEREELLRTNVRRPIFVVGNAIEASDIQDQTPESRMTAREELGIDLEVPLILRVGQLQERKGIADFLATAERLPDFHFVWVGGPIFGLASQGWMEMKRIMKQIRSNVTFTGVVKRPELLQWYQAADVSFNPSIQETFGLVVVEAARAGLPIVASNITEFQELFGNFISCVAADDYASAIIDAVHSGETRIRLQLGSRQLAARYSGYATVDAVVDVYRAVADGLADRPAQTPG